MKNIDDKYKRLENEIVEDLDPLEPDNRELTLIDDPKNRDTEAEELEHADERDVGEELRHSGKILASEDDIPSGMEGSARADDGEIIERRGEDLETGENGGDHTHRHAEAI